MEYTDKEFCLEVWSDMACFTRPELKVERVSYDVITPSAARAIFEAIFWKPAIRWQITKIEVLNPIKWTSIRRNEVGAVASKKPIYIEEKRQQKNTLCLQNVRYRLWAKLIFIPQRDRKNEKGKVMTTKTQQNTMKCLSAVPAKVSASISHTLVAESFLPRFALWKMAKNSSLPLPKTVTLASCCTTWTFPIQRTYNPCFIAQKCSKA